MLLVTKLHKNLIHYENTTCAILSCYVTLYTCRYYIVFGKSFYTSHHHVYLHMRAEVEYRPTESNK